METCKACGAPLTVLIQHEDSEEHDGYLPDASSSASKQGVLVDDDVELQCGCHFHWWVDTSDLSLHIYRLNQLIDMVRGWEFRICLLESYTITECPRCGKDLTTVSVTEHGSQQILCNIKNEGGYHAGVDILPLLTEECYLKTFPDERRARAFLDFCREGDIEAIVSLLGDEDVDEEEDGEGDGAVEECEDDGKAEEVDNDEEIKENRIDVLRYQDASSSMVSALHVAVIHGRLEVAWLLLFLASSLPTSDFPMEVLQAAEQLQLSREEQSDKVDIRALKDEQGMTAADVATVFGGVWTDWLASGRLIV